MLHRLQYSLKRQWLERRSARVGIATVTAMVISASICALAAVGSAPARAADAAGSAGSQGAGQGVVSVGKGAVTTVDLGVDAGTVTVADPEIADVMPVGGKRLIIQGRALGQTGLLVHDQAGGVLVNATIIVTPQRERTVVVIRGVEEDTMVCDPRCASLSGPRKNDDKNKGGAGSESINIPAAPNSDN